MEAQHGKGECLTLEEFLRAVAKEASKKAQLIEADGVTLVTITSHISKQGGIRAIDFRVDTKTELLR